MLCFYVFNIDFMGKKGCFNVLYGIYDKMLYFKCII